MKTYIAYSIVFLRSCPLCWKSSKGWHRWDLLPVSHSELLATIISFYSPQSIGDPWKLSRDPQFEKHRNMDIFISQERTIYRSFHVKWWNFIPSHGWAGFVTAGGNCLFELIEFCVVFFSPAASCPPEALNSCSDPSSPPLCPCNTHTLHPGMSKEPLTLWGFSFSFEEHWVPHCVLFIFFSIIKLMPYKAFVVLGEMWVMLGLWA